jgi:hypothetical protein
MKKISLLITLITILFLLTACGSGSAVSDGASTNGGSTNSFRNGANTTGPLNPEAKLALGTIKLEGTKQAVDPKMAANLVPLWQLMFQLNSSTSTAPQEVTAVEDQIKTTMTSEQINTINSMKLTQADIFTVFQQEAQANGTGGSNSTGGTGPSNFGGGNRGNRGNGGGGFVFVEGGGPGGFGGGGFGGGARNNGGTGSTSTTTTSSAQTAAQAAQAAQARQNAISNLLINQLIRLLETKLRS